MEQFDGGTGRDSVFWSMREESGSPSTDAATLTNRAHGVTVGKS